MAGDYFHSLAGQACSNAIEKLYRRDLASILALLLTSWAPLDTQSAFLNLFMSVILEVKGLLHSKLYSIVIKVFQGCLDFSGLIFMHLEFT